jgi:L-threonylcarbamoyladenylate synthase
MGVTEELAARLASAAACLRGGGIVVYPTETFYGLGTLASLPGALARLAAAKLRPAGKPLPLIAADRGQVEEVASLVSPLARRLAGRFWPGPLTLVLPAARGLDEILTGGSDTIAVRIPGSDVARALAARAGGPLVSTSANLSGEPPPTRIDQLSAELVARVDLVLDGGATPGGLPSTVVSALGGAPELVRSGAVPFAEVEAAAREAGTGGACRTR